MRIFICIQPRFCRFAIHDAYVCTYRGLWVIAVDTFGTNLWCPEVPSLECGTCIHMCMVPVIVGTCVFVFVGRFVGDMYDIGSISK